MALSHSISLSTRIEASSKRSYDTLTLLGCTLAISPRQVSNSWDLNRELGELCTFPDWQFLHDGSLIWVDAEKADSTCKPAFLSCRSVLNISDGGYA